MRISSAPVSFRHAIVASHLAHALATSMLSASRNRCGMGGRVEPLFRLTKLGQKMKKKEKKTQKRQERKRALIAACGGENEREMLSATDTERGRKGGRRRLQEERRGQQSTADRKEGGTTMPEAVHVTAATNTPLSGKQSAHCCEPTVSKHQKRQQRRRVFPTDECSQTRHSCGWIIKSSSPRVPSRSAVLPYKIRCAVTSVVKGCQL